ncbi:hypothetical protein Acr_29g0011640 [Actinidia rufa]|uniref:Uncharacterized protein n=1 Tax=Actinidia rufa TaxID=165716 RepID=A0A7J0HG60_9ERIC|nr:hypothetical protein Acr_29g0011640 [Actinidia rufa]
MIPRANKNATQQEPKMIQQSAPVNIPDWSKIYGNSSKKASNGNWDSDDDEDDDDGDGKMMPPHEWIARKHARSEVYSSSVCEGAGRTLKGRDLSRSPGLILVGSAGKVRDFLPKAKLSGLGKTSFQVLANRTQYLEFC